MTFTFRIHPEIESYIRKQSEEENRLLEESIIAEGCRDPLVVWEEQNVLVDGHHRIAICRKHGLAYSVVYRSFPDIEAVKAWMDLNQLGRRNLSKEDRDELIRRLAAAGHKQKEIAEAVGLTRSGVANIISAGVQKGQAPDFTNSELTVTAKLKDELARAKEKIALLETLKRGHKEHDEEMHGELEKLRREAREWERKAIEAANAYAVEPEKVIVEKVVEKEVTPPAVEAKLREQENLIYELQRREAGNPRLEEKRNAILKEIEQLREERSKTRVEASFDGVISLIMNQKALAQNIVDLAKNGDLTIQQMDEAQNLMSNVIAAANDVLHELRVIRGEFKKGGGLRAL